MSDRESQFRDDLRAVLNRYSRENGSNTPDFILADYLAGCLASYDAALTARDKWFDFNPWGKREAVTPPNGEARRD